MNKLKTLWEKFSLETKMDYEGVILSLLLFLGKKIFSNVHEICPNNKEKFVILSNDPKLNGLVKNVASPAEVKKTRKPRVKKDAPKKSVKKISVKKA